MNSQRSTERVWPGFFYFRKDRWRRDLLNVIESLATLLDTRMPLKEGLESFAIDAPSRRVEAMCMLLAADIGTGLSIFEGLARRPRFYPAHYRVIVCAAEGGDALPGALRSLADELVDVLTYRGTAKQYIAYLVAILTVLIVQFWALCVFLVPQMVQIVDEFEQPIPSGLGRLYVISSWLRGMETPWIALAIIVLAWVGLRVAPRVMARTAALGWLAGLACVALPPLRATIAKRHLAYAASAMGLTLRGGLSTIEAVKAVRSLPINPLYTGAFERVGRRLAEGYSLSDAVYAERRLLPPSFRGLVSIGENAGLLEPALAKLAAMYRRDVLKSLRITSELLAPAGLIVIGALICMFFLALLGSVEPVFEAARSLAD